MERTNTKTPFKVNQDSQKRIEEITLDLYSNTNKTTLIRGIDSSLLGKTIMEELASKEKDIVNYTKALISSVKTQQRYKLAVYVWNLSNDRWERYQFTMCGHIFNNFNLS